MIVLTDGATASIVAGERKTRTIAQPRNLHLMGEWFIRVLRGNRWDDYGCVSRATVTSAAVTELLTVMTGGVSSALANFKWHAIGTGTSAESSSNTTLDSQLGSRALGDQTIVAPNKYQSFATITAGDDAAITEAGIFSASSGGVLLDRGRITTTIVVDSGQQVESTYLLTLIGS